MPSSNFLNRSLFKSITPYFFFSNSAKHFPNKWLFYPFNFSNGAACFTFYRSIWNHHLQNNWQTWDIVVNVLVLISILAFLRTRITFYPLFISDLGKAAFFLSISDKNKNECIFTFNFTQTSIEEEPKQTIEIDIKNSLKILPNKVHTRASCSGGGHGGVANKAQPLQPVCHRVIRVTM